MNKACEFRTKEVLNMVSGEVPGWYRWYATREDLDFLLEKLGSDFDSVKDDLLVKDGLYAIYVGIAVNESIRARLNWHINEIHTLGKVKNGFLSTLRKTFSSLVANDQSAQKETDDFIDRLYVEYFEVPGATKESLNAIEDKEMAEHLFILNIQKNKHPKAKGIIKELKKIRKVGKENGLAKLMK